MKQWIICDKDFDPEWCYYCDSDYEEDNCYMFDGLSYDYWFNVEIGDEEKFVNDTTFQTTNDNYYSGAEKSSFYDYDLGEFRKVTKEDIKKLKDGDLKIIGLHTEW